MNEKTPNQQTQAAMTEARTMARNRMPELAQSNVWCGQCRHETTITNFSGTIKGGDLLLVGKCAECRSDVARVIEGS